MPIKYKIVKRKDMSKDAPADAKKFYASSHSNGLCSFEELCEAIADRSTASVGDVRLVLEGCATVMKQRLQKGETVQLGEIGNFRPVLGSSGVVKEEDFNASLIRVPRLVCYPGKKLKESLRQAKVEKVVPDVVEVPCDKEHIE